MIIVNVTIGVPFSSSTISRGGEILIVVRWWVGDTQRTDRMEYDNIFPANTTRWPVLHTRYFPETRCGRRRREYKEPATCHDENNDMHLSLAARLLEKLHSKSHLIPLPCLIAGNLQKQQQQQQKKQQQQMVH